MFERIDYILLGNAVLEQDETPKDFMGYWDASTNEPFLTNGIGKEGSYYEVSVAGTVDFGAGNITFDVGDYVVYNNGIWSKSAAFDVINDDAINLYQTWSSDKIDSEIKSAGAVLGEDITANVTVGGVNAGDVLPEGLSFDDYVKKVHVKYNAPTLSMTTNKTLLNKVGSIIGQPIQIKATSTKKTYNIQKTAISLGGEELASGTNPNGETVTLNYTNNITTNTTFTGSVYDGKQTVTSSLKFEFIVPFYYGVLNNNTVSSLTGLTELLEKKGNKTITVSPNNQYVVYLYDSSYGNLVKIEDTNGYNVTASFNRSEVTIDGQTYKCYVANNKSTNPNFKYTFKFTE